MKGHGLDILLFDDNDLVRDALCLMLEDRGHRVRAVSNLSALQQELSRRLPDVLLTDMQAPGQCDGVAIAAARALSRDLPILAMSGGEAQQMRKLAEAFGADEFLAKPFRSSVIDTHMLRIGRAAA